MNYKRTIEYRFYHPRCRYCHFEKRIKVQKDVYAAKCDLFNKYLYNTDSIIPWYKIRGKFCNKFCPKPSKEVSQNRV